MAANPPHIAIPMVAIPGSLTGSQRERRKRLEDILQDPRAHPSPSDCKFLVDHIAPGGAPILARLVPQLSLALIPSEPLLETPMPPESPVFSAWTGLVMLSTIVQSFHKLDSSSTSVTSFAELLRKTLLDEWQGITGWMAYLLYHRDTISSGSDQFFLVRACANLLLTIATEAKHDTISEDLATQASTIDCVYLLLGCKGHSAEAEWYCDAPNDRNAGGCIILELFRACFEVPSGPAAMRQGIHRKTRKAGSLIARSLERRGEQLIWGRMSSGVPAGITFNPGSLRSLVCLIGGVVQLVMDTSLWDVFKRMQPFLHTYSYAFANISEMAEMSGSRGEDKWLSLGSCAYMITFCATRLSPNPRAALTATFTDGHFLRGAAICFSNIEQSSSSRNQVFEAVQMAAPYLYLSKIYRAANSRDEVSKWIERKNFRSAKATELLSESKRLLRGATPASGLTSLCSSSQHYASRERSKKDMVCSGCKSAVYCSVWCQKQDWRLHSSECKRISNLHREGPRLSICTRLDQRHALQGIINLELPPAWEVNQDGVQLRSTANAAPGPQRMIQGLQSLSVSSFDLMTGNSGRMRYKRIPVMSLFSDRKYVDAFEPWIARIKEWVHDVEMNWMSTILVEGIFQHDSQHLATVLAKAGNIVVIGADGKEESRSYGISSTIFSVVPISQP